MMSSKEIRTLPAAGALTSRREVLRRSVAVAAASVFAPVWTRRAWAQSAPSTFDFYISTTGLDSNPGTLAQPWSINAINNKGSTYAGKRVGIVDGTYNVYDLCQNSTSGNSIPALNVTGGTPSSPTVIAAVNPRQAILTAANPTTGNYPTTECSIIGQGSGPTLGNVIIDGLFLTKSYEGAVQFAGTSTGEGGPAGIIVRNCEIYDIAGYENDNIAGVHLHSVTGALVQNCLIHKVYASSGNPDHNVAGILTFNCYSNVYEYNTIYDTPVGIYDKNGPNGNHTYCYNYIEIPGALAGGYSGGITAINDAMGGVTGDVLTIHHNIFIAPTLFTGGGGGGGGEQNSGMGPAEQSLLFYNNTCVFSGSAGSAGGSGGIYYPSAGTAVSPAASTQHYNNIYYSSDTSNQLVAAMFQQGAATQSDYNCYPSQSNIYSLATVNAPNSGSRVSYSLVNWQSKYGLDGHSFKGDPQFTTAGASLNPAGYQLASASPCAGTGKGGGNMGAWDQGVTQIGCNFGSGAVSGTAPPNSPSKLIVS